MRGPQLRRGFALALLLWMIAGMSLMVMAVIHAAHSDIAMAELYVGEARARAASRGAALLAVRDKVLLDGEASGQSEKAGDEASQRRFVRAYGFWDDLEVTATVLPSNAFTSLNDASHEELMRVMMGMGGLSQAAAKGTATAVVEYRDTSSEESMERRYFDGFRAREELLAIRGFSREAYDRVKDFVHPYRGGALDPSLAPDSVTAFYGEESVAAAGGAAAPVNAGFAGGSSDNNAEAQTAGLVTFDSIWEAKRRASLGLGAGGSAVPVEIKVVMPSGSVLNQRVWLSGPGGSILRAEAPFTRFDKEGG
jgi:hypothetical protein